MHTAAVLHLEDSDLDAELIRARLERSGLPLALDRVSDRAGFLDRLAGRRYDVILSDYQVPSFADLEALDLARAHQPGVPFIFVTGALGEEVAVETLRRGATDYILKERLARLAPAVERALAEARERAERCRAEGRAAAILESMSEGFVVLDADWRFAYVNAAFERMNGVRREDVLGRDHWAVYPATVGTRLEAEYRRVVAEGATVEFENHYEPWDRWFAVKAYPADGGGVCVQVREVTGAKRAEADLRASEERYRTLFESMDEGYCIIEMLDDPADPARPTDYRFAEVNPAFERHTGLVGARGRTARELVPDLDAHWFETYGRVAATGAPVRFVNRSEAMGRWFDVYAFRLGGPGSRRVAILFTDITPRKRDEQERERLLAELARREEELRLVTDAVPVLISYLDAGGVYRFANRAYETWFGRPREQVVGRHLSEVLGADVWGLLRPHVERVLRGERHEFETFAPYRDGGGRHVRVSYVPRFDGDRVVGFFALVADVTAAKRAEEALRDADRKKDEFLALLAHELRNPLAPIRNALQVVKLSDDRAVRERARDTMERQLGQMVRLVDDLLDVSRITRGKLELRRERIDAAAVVAQAVETARPHVEAAGHHLAIELPPGPVPLHADPVRLAQVLANLLNNAAKYTNKGGRIRLAVERHGAEVAIGVRDNGVGIPADMLPRVFDLFTQVDSSREKAQGGLGIGLTLVRRLVELHGGTVEARSDGPGRGSEFVVRLPAADAPPAPSADGRPGDRAAARSALRVLVVDDNRDVADSLAEVLQLLGNDARTAYDGEEAVATAAEYRPEVVLLDIGLPKLSGHEVCRRIRALPGGGGVVVIAQSGWGQEGDLRLSREAGFDRHLVKPVDPDVLMKVLTDVRAVRR